MRQVPVPLGETAEPGFVLRKTTGFVIQLKKQDKKVENAVTLQKKMSRRLEKVVKKLES